MFKRVLATLAITTVALVGPSLSAAQAAPGGPNVKQCKASDRSDVQVDKKTDAVTVAGDTSTFGNNYSCVHEHPGHGRGDRHLRPTPARAVAARLGSTSSSTG